MDPAEYLAFVPLLFYGISLAELLRQWRRFFDREYFYLPYFVTTVIFTELAIWNVYGYLAAVERLAEASYPQYWAYLLQPILFLLTVSALTPESEESDTEVFFTKRLRLVYGLMAAFLFSNLVGSDDALALDRAPRLVGIALCIAVAVTRRFEIFYFLAVAWFFGLLMRL